MNTSVPNPTGQPVANPRRLPSVLVLVVGVITFSIAVTSSPYLALVYLYGSERVSAEHLRFTDMPKGGTWIVSNGDHVANAEFIRFIIGVSSWMALFLAISWVVCRVLLKRKDTNAA